MQIGNLQVVVKILVPNILILEGNCVWQICIQSRQFYCNSYWFKANLQFEYASMQAYRLVMFHIACFYVMLCGN